MKIIQELKSQFLRNLSTPTLQRFSKIVENNGFFSKIIWSVGFIVSSFFLANFGICTAKDFLRFDFVISKRLKTEPTPFPFPTFVICSELYPDLGLAKFLIDCDINQLPCNYTHFEEIEIYDPFEDFFITCNKFAGLSADNQFISKNGYGSTLKFQLLLQSDGKSIDKMFVYIKEQGIRPFYENIDITCKGGTKIDIEMRIEKETKLGYPYR